MKEVEGNEGKADLDLCYFCSQIKSEIGSSCGGHIKVHLIKHGKRGRDLPNTLSGWIWMEPWRAGLH